VHAHAQGKLLGSAVASAIGLASWYAISEIVGPLVHKSLPP